MNRSDPTLPNYVREEAAAVSEDLTLIADLLAGTRRMWAQSQVAHYIRKWKDEDQTVYDIRRQCEVLFEGLARVLSASVGMLFAKAPTLAWNGAEAAMTDQLANVDAQGTAWTVFAKRFADQSLRDGLGIIVVDHPSPPDPATLPEGRITSKNTDALGLRPTWAMYPRASAGSWFDDVVTNERTLTQLTLAESGTLRAGTFGAKKVQRYRDLRMLVTDEGDIATWTLYEEADQKAGGEKGFKRVGSGVFRNKDGKPCPKLPIAIAYAGRSTGPMDATIPLMGVAWANLAHWQIATDLRFGRMVAGIEQPVVEGELMPEGVGQNGAAIPGRIRLGWMTAVHVAQGAKFSWEGPKGTGLATLVDGKAEKMQEIGQQGMSFMVTDTRAAETAEAKRLDATAENSTLATAKQGIEDALNTALELHWWYLGGEKATAPVVQISGDFDNTVMDAQTMAVYVDAVVRAGLPEKLLLNAWMQGGRLPPDTDIDALILDMAANRAAIDTQAAAEKAAALAPPLAA